MPDEFPDSLDEPSEYLTWVSNLADNAVRSATGQAKDADYTGDLANTPESRIESEVELEIDDKIDVLAGTRTPFDVLRFSEQNPTEHILDTLTPDRSVRESALQLAFDALYQDVMAEARNSITPAEE